MCDAEAQTRGNKGTGSSCRQAGSWLGTLGRADTLAQALRQNAVAAQGPLPFPLPLAPGNQPLLLPGLPGWWGTSTVGCPAAPMDVRGGSPIVGDHMLALAFCQYWLPLWLLPGQEEREEGGGDGGKSRGGRGGRRVVIDSWGTLQWENSPSTELWN